MIDSEILTQGIKESNNLGGIPKENVARTGETWKFSEGVKIQSLDIGIGREFTGKIITAEYLPVFGDDNISSGLQICLMGEEEKLPEIEIKNGLKIDKEDFSRINGVLRLSNNLELPSSFVAGLGEDVNAKIEGLKKNGQFYYLLGMTDKDGNKHPLIMNREVDGKKGGDTNVVISPDGRIMMEYRSSLWGVRPEAPRAFANVGGYETRLREEVGLEGSLRLLNKVLVWEDPLYMGSQNCVNIVQFEGGKTGERVINGGVSLQWVMEMSKIGMIRDGYTLASMMIAGLLTDKIDVNPERKDMLEKKIIFEEKYMPHWDNERHLFLPRGKQDEGAELGKVISNSGMSNIEYSSKVVSFDRVAGMGENRMVSVSIGNILELIKSGKLDMVTTAALTQYLYNEKIVLCRG